MDEDIGFLNKEVLLTEIPLRAKRNLQEVVFSSLVSWRNGLL